MTKTQFLNIADIRADKSAQQREKIDWIYVQELKDVYEVNGEIEPILVFKDAEGLLWLADGFHRLEGAKKAGCIKIRGTVEKGSLRDAILYSCSANAKHGLKRTNADKLRAVTTLLTDNEWGEWNNSEIARRTGTSPEFVRQHRAVLQPTEEGQEQAKKVKRGGKEYTMAPRAKAPKSEQPAPDDTALQLLKDTPTADDSKQIEQLAQLPADRQIEVAGLVRNGEARDVKDAQRQLNRKELGTAELPEGKYNLILADPPWPHDNEGFKFAAESKYPTMTLEQIKELEVIDLADSRAVLFLWGTVPLAAEALEVIKAWGFEYKTKLAWVKNRVGPGFYTMGKYEELYIATRGSHVTPAWRPENVFFGDVREHSQKPDEVIAMIERMYPDLTARLELFARTTRPGWASWGNQTDKFSEAA